MQCPAETTMAVDISDDQDSQNNQVFESIESMDIKIYLFQKKKFLNHLYNVIRCERPLILSAAMSMSLAYRMT